ncbi:multidrug ABC transporter ATP-binding protein [Clostridium sulfidigenes]|uniref:Multidrug ABC transporter ATP-binding protein n=1 Tax=Clostridium sulfidigenes TaxID=318464 RepID=A0A084JEX6_9CLOT|nr:ATP-binding cassette domain-containing protein [Clostridium sulfidigenes]KEZ87510.1 multidrug ABC transporter ATP-binding protein [Clostridium sulfidigenes]
MEIEVRNLTKIISGNLILDNINIKMTRGKIYGLKGKNGSGKTMLMRAICGLILPTEGEVIIDGQVLGKDISFPNSLGALIESPGFISNYSGFKNLKILSEIQGKIDDNKINEVLTMVGLDPKEKKKFKKYSLGMKQKLGIAAAIMEEPEIIILDEPTNALDESSVISLRKTLQKYRDAGALIIISCHDSEELEFLSDEIFFMENGRLKPYNKRQKEGDSYEEEK